MSCQFCAELERLEEHEKFVEAHSEYHRHEFGVVLLQIDWNQLSGRHHWGEMTHRPRPEGFKLNYCPECGQRIGGEKSGECDQMGQAADGGRVL